MRTLLLVLALAVGLLGLSPTVTASWCLEHGPAHAHDGAVPAEHSFAHTHSIEGAVTAAEQEPRDPHDGARLAAEGCCHAAPSIIQSADVDPATPARAARLRPASRDVRGDGRRPFDIFRPPASA